MFVFLMILMCQPSQCTSISPPTLTSILTHFAALTAPPAASLELPAFNATCAPAALQLMARAQMCIHAYWPFEAVRALAHALRADAECAAAHMLLAAALAWNPGYDAARFEAIKRAMARVDDTAAALSARERTLLRSLGAARRAAKFDHLMLAALRAWPHDVEVQFLWIKRLTTRSIRALGAPSELDRAQAQAMLDDMLRLQSLSPMQRAVHAHYEIHAWDDTLRPESALRAAELLLLGDGFDAPHLLHMSGHTFYSMGLFNRAVAVFERARRADLAFQRDADVEPINNWNFVHNWCYLVHALANSGRYADAVREATALGALRLEDAAAPEPLPFAVNASRCFGRWVFQGLLALPMVHWRLARFDRCAAAIAAAMPRLRQVEALHAWNEHVVQYFQFLHAYCDGMDHVLASRADLAAAALDNATRTLERLDDAVSDTSALARLAGRGTEALRVCLAELAAAIAFTRDDDGESAFGRAIALERDLPYSEPSALPRSPRDTFVELLLRRRRGDDLARAERLALELIELPPKPVFAMAASAQIMEASGNANAAIAHWAAVRAAWSDADADLELVQRARAHSELRR